VTKIIGDNYRIYDLIIILNVEIVTIVRCRLFKMSNVSHLTILLPMGTHDAVRDVFATIAWSFGFHVAWERLYAFSLPTFNSSCWWVEIVLMKDEIRILPNWCYHCWFDACEFISLIFHNSHICCLQRSSS